MFEFVLGREEEALRHAEELIRDMPGRADLHEQRALILCDMGRFDEARIAAGRALAGAPKHPEFLDTMGIVERMAGNPGAALPRLVDSAVARPSYPRARAELAVCQVQLGRVGEATAALETLPRYALRDPFVTYAQAALAIARGADDDAIVFLREAGRVRPELGIRAGVDPLFRAILGDNARRVGFVQAVRH